MPTIVGVRFKPATKIYYFDPGELLDLQKGDQVVVETAKGCELGRVAVPPKEVSPEEIVGPLKPVLRVATAADLADAQHHASLEAEALLKCRAKAAESGLPIKVVAAEYNLDGSHLTFFFTSEQRVDFRTLVRDLARMFHARIELGQVGVRDEARLIKGLGPCGRPLCCATHLSEFIPVSIKMAKAQDLPLSPMEISGVCGRLLCCLTYENAYYHEARSRMPKMGEVIRIPEGVGKVVGHNVLRETVRVELESGITAEVPLTEIGLSERPEQDSIAPSRRQEGKHDRQSERRKHRSIDLDS